MTNVSNNNIEKNLNKHPTVEFISSNDMSLKLMVLGYEFKDSSGDVSDKNWYNSKIVLRGKNLSAKLIGANLLATEVKFLLDEFRKIENGESKEFVLNPMEPYFEFNVKSDEIDSLKINGFMMPENKDVWENQVIFSFSVNKHWLPKIINQLDHVLEVFPIRE
jgi:hypothetical protein